MPITQICAVSGQKFCITDADLDFYKKMEVPPPTLCPKERMRRRLAYRNESSLHRRKSNASGTSIISMYASEQPFPVYENEYWWGDGWSAKDYGRNYDFGRPFFEQFFELLNEVPKMARIQQGDDLNSTFTNCASYNKNCYMIFSSNRNEDCMYGNFVLECRDCVDGFNNQKCELTYESIDSTHCYEVQHCERVHHSRNMYHCYDCRNAENCFACAKFWNKKGKYWVLNKEVSAEYFQSLLHDPTQQKKVLAHLPDLKQRLPERGLFILQSENVTGAYIRRSKNAIECWNVEDCEDCKFCNDLSTVRSSYDVSYYGCTQTNELLYECEGVGHGAFNIKFSKLCWGGCANLDYCWECFSCSDCFGCTGLRNAQFCIFNKQYSQAEYQALREKIINHMTASLEWGEFFPIELSPFAYNQTVAQDYLPISADIAKKAGVQWVVAPEVESIEPRPPMSNSDASVLKKILICQATGKPYKIEKPELKFYQKNNLPIPDFCPEERHRRRLSLRPKRALHPHICAQCQVQIETTFPPSEQKNVYCDKCYLKFVA